jgi:hypothetical protein
VTHRRNSTCTAWAIGLTYQFGCAVETRAVQGFVDCPERISVLHRCGKLGISLPIMNAGRPARIPTPHRTSTARDVPGNLNSVRERSGALLARDGWRALPSLSGSLPGSENPGPYAYGALGVASGAGLQEREVNRSAM